jgi:hypothetical protein
MGHSFPWDAQEIPYEHKITRQLGKSRWVALSIFLIGVGVTGWQTLAFAFHSDAAQSNHLGNLHKLQSTMPSTHAAPTLIASNPMSEESIKREMNDPLGRPDPFSPLVKEIDPATVVDTKAPEAPRDILQDVSYTGFIGDKSSANKVAILHIADPGNTETTVIKKVGESFLVEGQSVTLRSIDNSGIRVNLAGNTRFLNLQAFQATPQTSGAAAAGNPMAGSSPSWGNGPPPGMNKTRGPGFTPSSPGDSAIPGGASLQNLPE